jgi:hypothetical protein
MAVGGFVAQLLPNKKKGRILTADNWRLDAQVVQRGLRHCRLQIKYSAYIRIFVLLFKDRLIYVDTL